MSDSATDQTRPDDTRHDTSRNRNRNRNSNENCHFAARSLSCRTYRHEHNRPSKLFPSDSKVSSERASEPKWREANGLSAISIQFVAHSSELLLSLLLPLLGVAKIEALSCSLSAAAAAGSLLAAVGIVVVVVVVELCQPYMYLYELSASIIKKEVACRCARARWLPGCPAGWQAS